MKSPNKMWFKALSHIWCTYTENVGDNQPTAQGRYDLVGVHTLKMLGTTNALHGYAGCHVGVLTLEMLGTTNVPLPLKMHRFGVPILLREKREL